MAVCPSCTTEFHGDEQFCPRDGTPLQISAGSDKLVGRVLSGRYRLLSQLGQGGMGSVYRAHHILMDKPVAVKVLRQELAQNSEAVARFHREARSASKLDHENVIRVMDFGQSDDALLFLVMELLDGDSLAALVAHARLPWRRAAEIARDVALGLSHAHEQGVVHRDLKPENIVLARRGRSGRPVVKVLDFGLAKLMHDVWSDDGDPAGKKSLTRTGVVFGTPEYMSPEQAEGLDLDHRTDIYGLGVLLYQMVTGDVPFTGATLLALITKTVQDPPQPPTERVPGLDLPPPLEALILRCMEKSPAARPESAEVVVAELDEIFRAYPDSSLAGRAVSAAPARLLGTPPHGQTPAGLPAVGMPAAGTLVLGTPLSGTLVAGTPVAGLPVVATPLPTPALAEAYSATLSATRPTPPDPVLSAPLLSTLVQPPGAGGVADAPHVPWPAPPGPVAPVSSVGSTLALPPPGSSVGSTLALPPPGASAGATLALPPEELPAQALAEAPEEALPRRRSPWVAVAAVVLLVGGGAGGLYWARQRVAQPGGAALTGAGAQGDGRALPQAQELLAKNRPDEALALLSVERQQRNSPQLQRLLSATYEAKKNRLRALGHMYAAQTLARGTPEAPETQAELAHLLMRLGHGPEACKVTGELLSARPTGPLLQRAEALTKTLHCKHKP